MRFSGLGLLALSLVSTAPLALSQNWTLIRPGFASEFELDPVDANHLTNQVFPAGGGVLIEETWDGGLTWSPVAMPAAAGLINGADFGPDGTLYLRARPPVGATGPRALAFRRDPLGWTPVGPLFTRVGGGFDWVSKHVGVSATDPAKMVLGLERFGGGGEEHIAYETSDGGASWNSFATGDALVQLSIEFIGGREQVLRLDQYNPSTGSEGTWWLDDPWQAGPSRALFSYLDFERPLRTGRVQPEHMYLLDLVPGTFAERLLASTDAGATWEPRGADGAFRGFARANVDTTLLVRTAYVSLPTLDVTFEVSRDGGRTWTAGAPIPQPFLANAERFRFSADDSRLYMGAGEGLYSLDFVNEVGQSECQSGINSSGLAAVITARGSRSVLANDLTLWATQMAPNQSGILLASTTAGFTANPGGSFGDLCLGGAIGRIADPVLFTGPFGEVSRRLDLGGLATPTGLVMAQAGETWRFQAWFRDFIGTQGSHLSDAVAVTFVP